MRVCVATCCVSNDESAEKQGLPVDGALVLVSEQSEALPEALPEVLEQWPVDSLQQHGML